MISRATDLISFTLLTRFLRGGLGLFVLLAVVTTQAVRAAVFREGYGGTLTVVPPTPTIVTHPVSAGGPVGSRVTFGVEVVYVDLGPPGAELTYQWYFNDEPISSAAARQATYTVVVSPARAGNYHVVVSNGFTATSDPATLTVYTRPKATLQPRGQTLDDGAPLTLTATATGTPAPAFQWFLDGEEIPGATSATFSIDAVDVFDTGAYKVRVTNAVGSAFSAPASVVVRSAPGISASPEDIETQAGKTVRLRVLAMGFPKLSYQWRFNGEPISGKAARAATYSFKATLARAGTYDVVVSNALGEATSETAEVIVTDAPKILTPPVGAKRRVGQDYQLVVAATGFPVPTYQWLKNGQELDGQTGATLDFASLALTDAGSYSVRVGNVHGTITTKPVELLVSLAPFSVGSKSTFQLNGMVYAVTGDSDVVDEQQTFFDGKIRLSYPDGDVDRYSYSYSRISATQAKIRINTKIDGTKVAVAYLYNFTSNTAGNFVVSVYANGYGTVISGNGSFTYVEPGL